MRQGPERLRKKPRLGLLLAAMAALHGLQPAQAAYSPSAPARPAGLQKIPGDPLRSINTAAYSSIRKKLARHVKALQKSDTIRVSAEHLPPNERQFFEALVPRVAEYIRQDIALIALAQERIGAAYDADIENALEEFSTAGKSVIELREKWRSVLRKRVDVLADAAFVDAFEGLQNDARYPRTSAPEELHLEGALDIVLQPFLRELKDMYEAVKHGNAGSFKAAPDEGERVVGAQILISEIVKAVASHTPEGGDSFPTFLNAAMRQLTDMHPNEKQILINQLHEVRALEPRILQAAMKEYAESAWLHDRMRAESIRRPDVQG